MDKYIKIKNAHENNLKNINIEIPRKSFIVITGVSGSGKSSLAFDTIYAEGHRRFIESLSSYARQFIKILKKPKLESIEGLSPAIAINQKSNISTPRSTVGTITEIYDYLRLLYTKLANPYCYNCQKPMYHKSPDQISKDILSNRDGTIIQIYSPVIRGRKGNYNSLINTFKVQGYIKVKVDGTLYSLDEDEPKLDKNKHHDIDLLIDKIIIKDKVKNRLNSAISTALSFSKGFIRYIIYNNNKPIREELISKDTSCLDCNISLRELEPRLFSFNSPQGACPNCKGLGYVDDSTICSSCNGKKLNVQALSYKIKKTDISQLCEFQIDELFSFINNLDKNNIITKKIIKELTDRLSFLSNIGLNYLSLNRLSMSLSGGEYQRVRLASQLGASLTGILYVLDEPSIGLHPSDNSKLINTLKKLKDKDNTVIVVEHDEETIRSADYIIDLGPGAGNLGGHISAKGSIQNIVNSNTLTGQYLSKKKSILKASTSINEKTSKPKNMKKYLEFYSLNNNNLKSIDIKIPLQKITCICGVSGSGKSSLLIDNILPNLNEIINKKNFNLKNCKKIINHELINQIYSINQAPIGRSPRSNPATYTGFYSYIRDLFSKLPESRSRNYKGSHFSFNVPGGRCSECEGQGLIKIEMKFLPDEYIVCNKCKGKKFKKEILEIKYKAKNISEVLDLSVREALDFFRNIQAIYKRLKTLDQVGLGYIKLGQGATTFSGGEAQRIKISKELSKKSNKNTLYILDEPTTGLHFDDINKLIKVLYNLRDSGNTILIIEHNPEIIKASDYIIELGPKGGKLGGYITALGTVDEIRKNKNSLTSKYI